MASLFNLARMTTATTGTGTITLGSAVTGFLTFAGAGVSSGDVVSYAVADGSNSEVGTGTYTVSGTTTLSRTVVKSTNSDAAINLTGNAQVFIAPHLEDFIGKQTIWVPASAMTAATTSGAAAGTVEETTNAHNYATLDFDASSDEYACFEIAMPKSWDLGTVSFIPYWSSTAADTDGVTWALQGVAVGDNENSDVAYGGAVVVADANQGAAGELLIGAESAAVTIAGTPAEGELVQFRAFRDVSDANDTATEDAQLRGYKILYSTRFMVDT